MEITVTGAGSGAQSRIATSSAANNDPANLVSSIGTGYLPGDSVFVAGGTLADGGTSTGLTITDTTVVTATVRNGGSGGTPGSVVLLGTTGGPEPCILGGTIGGAGALQSLTIANRGVDLMVGDVLNVIGGSFLAYAQLQVDFIGVATVTIVDGGHGGADGIYNEGALVIQGDEVFYKAYFSAVISGGSLVEIGVFDTGAYTSEIMGTVTLDGVVAGVTGLTGAMATLTWSVANPLIGPPGVSILAGGDYTATPSNPVSVDGISGFEFDATWSGGGSLVSIDYVASGGDYTTPPNNQFDELVTGGGLSDASITITMGAYAASILQPGSYLIPPTNPVVQETTSGGGTGVQFSLLYGGDLAAGSVVYDEIVDVGPDALLASMTYDADDYTSTSFEQPIDQPPYYTGLGAVDTTIVPGNNAANFTGWNTSTSSPPSAIVQPMPIDTTTSAGTVGTISGQIAVDMRTYDGINDGTSTASVLEIQIFNTPQTDEQLAAIRTSIANYFGFIPP